MIALFGVFIINLDANSYLRITPEKALAKAKNEKKHKYLQYYIECRRNLTPLFLSADRIPV